MEVSKARHQTMSSQLENAIMMSQNSQQEEEQQQIEKKVRPNNPEQSLKCPRCDSSNTKFCYYNNYSLSQPRYFCKGCRRYWTQGGSLRNVPVGGGCRKNKRSSSSSSSKKSQQPDVVVVTTNPNNNPLIAAAAAALPLPPLSYDPNELSLAFATLQRQPMLECDQESGFLVGNPNPNPNPNPVATAGFLDILRSGGGYVDHHSSSNSGLYYDGFGGVGEVEGSGGVSGGGGGMMFPYDGWLMSSSTDQAVTTTAAATATSQESMDGADEDKKFMMMGLQHNQWPGVIGAGDHANANSNLGMDILPVGDYWNNGVGSSNWPGLINSSLI